MILIGEAARELVERLRARLANENELPGRDCGRPRPAFTEGGTPPAVGAEKKKTPAFRSLEGAAAGGRTSFSGETDKLVGADGVE
jgi:hypothetical protein